MISSKQKHESTRWKSRKHAVKISWNTAQRREDLLNIAEQQEQ